MAIFGLIIGLLIGAFFSGFIIWIVGRMGLGIEVNGFGTAFIAALVIAVLTALIHWIWTLFGYSPPSGLWGAIIALIVSAGILVSAGSFVKGLKVNGFSGALIASAAIAAVAWLINWGVSFLV